MKRHDMGVSGWLAVAGLLIICALAIQGFITSRADSRVHEIYVSADSPAAPVNCTWTGEDLTTKQEQFELDTYVEIDAPESEIACMAWDFSSTVTIEYLVDGDVVEERTDTDPTDDKPVIIRVP